MLKSERLQIERKRFILTLKENPRGRFLRIAEDAGSHHNMIIVPASGLEEFSKILGEMLKASDAIAPIQPINEPGQRAESGFD